MTVLLTLILSTSSFAATEPGAHPGILQARQKILSGERKLAVQILTQAIELEKNEVRIDQLKKERARLATLFMTNEGQRFFELAESIRFSDQDNYMPHYEDSLKLEDGNAQVLISQSVGLLKAKDCSKAKLTLEVAKEMSPDAEEVSLLQAYALLCLESAELTKAKLHAIESTKYNVFKKILLAKKAKQEERKEESLAAAREVIALDKSYPSGYYWAWLAIQGEENVGLDEAQSYLSLCREMTPDRRRKYSLDPELCSETTRVEKFIRDMESQSQ